MSRYDPLERFLVQHRGASWNASFDEIERIIGDSLPASARKHPAWWANQSGAGHVQSAAWQGAGWRTTRLDLERRQVVFEKVRDDNSPAPPSPSTAIKIEERIELIRELTGMTDPDEIKLAGLEALSEKIAAAALAQMGGTMSAIEAPPRRRFF